MSLTHGTGSFTFEGWQEAELGAAPDGGKLAHASVTNHFTGAIEAARTTCTYSIFYETDKTGTCVGYELVDGTVAGRRGAFVLEERGTFGEDGTVHCAWEVVAGSATGELAGLAGSGGFTAVHGEPSVPYTFDFSLS